jgi:hypothetical protein
MKKLSFYVYVFYCFEIGIFLLLVPWWLPQVWEQNYFFFIVPSLKALFLNGFFRGAISGLGIFNIFLGVAEIVQHEHTKRLAETTTERNPIDSGQLGREEGPSRLS